MLEFPIFPNRIWLLIALKLSFLPLRVQSETSKRIRINFVKINLISLPLLINNLNQK